MVFLTLRKEKEVKKGHEIRKKQLLKNFVDMSDLSYVDINIEATGKHYNLPGHSKWDMKVTVLEKIHSRDLWMREEREHELIRKCNTFYKGINRQI